MYTPHLRTHAHRHTHAHTLTFLTNKCIASDVFGLEEKEKKACKYAEENYQSKLLNKGIEESLDYI